MKMILFVAALALLCGCGKTSKEEETSARFAIERYEVTFEELREIMQRKTMTHEEHRK